MEVTKRLLEIMRERNLTQADVCRLTKVQPSVMCKLVAGERKQVSAKTIKQLAVGLGVNVMEFYVGKPVIDDTEYVLLVKKLVAAGITKERLEELAEWVGKIKKPGG